MDLLQAIFDLAEHEKALCQLGEFNSDDKAWIEEEIAYLTPHHPNGDGRLCPLGVADISELVGDFIRHCEEVRSN